MNSFLQHLLAWFYSKSKLAFDEQKCRKIKTSSNISLGQDVRIGSYAAIPTDIGSICIGDRTWFEGTLNLFPHNIDCTFTIGTDSYVGDGTRIWCAKKIAIGNRVLIAHNVDIFDTTTHPIDKRLRYEHEIVLKTHGMPKEKYETIEEASVVIEDDVWVGCNAIILKGVRIGEGAIVAAGSVVVKDVPPNTMVAGNPARIVKRLE